MLEDRAGRSSLARLLTLVAILLSATIVFRVGMTYFFAQDDFLFLSRLAQVQTADDAVRLFLRSDHFYRPVARVMMLGIPFAAFGASALGYHLFNLGLHLISSTLVYRMLRRLGSRPGVAAFGMGIYTFYPANFTPVLWISGIQELSVTLFVLLSCLVYFSWLRRPRDLWRFGLALIAYLAALLSKETAILLPVWLAVTPHLITLPGARGGSAVRSVALSQVAFGLVAVGYLIIRGIKADVTGEGGPYIISLAWDSVWSNLRHYALDLYGLAGYEWDLSIPLSIVAVGGLALAALVPGMDRRRLATGVLWVFCFLSPSLALLNRHYSYYFSLATIGVVIILSAVGDYVYGVVSERGRRGRELVSWVGTMILVAWIAHAALQLDDPRRDTQRLKSKGDRAYRVISDLQSRRAEFMPGTVLYVLGAQGEDVAIFGSGALFTFYYPELGRVVFDRQSPQADAEMQDSSVYVFPVPP